MRAEWESVLKALKTISDKYDIIEKHTGRRFNVYSIAGMERDEVYTHSRMIAELLNPKGSHGQNGKYLKLYCDKFLENCFIESHDRAIVSVERTVEEGRIDVYVELPELLLIIENKIDAPDQSRQLERYHSHAKNKKTTHVTFYLTLDGHKPSADSLGMIDEIGNEKIKIISYANDIFGWIEDCLILSLDLPNVYSGLRQYMNLIRKITGNTMNTEQNNEIGNFLFDNPEFFSAAFKLSDLCTQPVFRGKILYEFFGHLEKYLAPELKPDVPLFAKIEALTNDLESFQYSKSNCIAWFERGNKKKGWESKGFFLRILGLDNFLLHVEVATDALHYGIVPLATIQSEHMKSFLRQPQTFISRPWGPKNEWYSLIKDDNVNKFTPQTIELLTNQKIIKEFANTISAEVQAMLLTINEADPT